MAAKWSLEAGTSSVRLAFTELINIAARMEEAAKTHNVACAISGDVTAALTKQDDRLCLIGNERAKGISAEIPIFEYRIGDS
jgi:class 3 adenylate cyclase